MSIDSYMTKDLITVFLDDDLRKVKSKFDKFNLHHLLVIDDDGVLSGVITDRDLFKHLSPTVDTMKQTRTDLSMLNNKVHKIMNRKLTTGNVNFTINEAVVSFHENHISCLPIVDQDMKPIGIITWRDIIKIIALQYRQKMAQKIIK